MHHRHVTSGFSFFLFHKVNEADEKYGLEAEDYNDVNDVNCLFTV
jgi:hypothetical protein